MDMIIERYHSQILTPKVLFFYLLVFMLVFSRIKSNRPTPPPIQPPNLLLSTQRQQFVDAAVCAGG